MGWSVGRRPLPESDLIDEILLSAGKALYLANMFESKCAFVLQIANLTDIIEADPVISLERATAMLPGGKMLGGTLRDLLSRTDVGISEEQSTTITKARLARNYIAHEGAAAIGLLWTYNVQAMLDALRGLRAKVIDLANGDNIVSAWVYDIEEPREPRPYIMADYPDLVDDWVFGHLPCEWLDPDWRPDHTPPRGLREAIQAANFYEPWYSQPCRCSHQDDE